MTRKAREVLSDCRLALAFLEEECDLDRWRVHWAGAVALIRVVGHVLDKVDGRDPRIKTISNARYKLWSSDAEEHAIFREFIDKERNNLLKEYEINVHPLEEVSLVLQTTLMPAAGGDPIRSAEIFGIGENIYRPILDGPWQGNDARDVLSLAIEWWEEQLTTIDAELSETK